MAHSIVIIASFVCHVDAPRRPLEQLDPQMPFELLDLLTQRRIGCLQGFRGSRKAAGFDDPNEGPDCLHVVYDTTPVMHAVYAVPCMRFPCGIFIGAITQRSPASVSTFRPCPLTWPRPNLKNTVLHSWLITPLPWLHLCAGRPQRRLSVFSVRQENSREHDGDTWHKGMCQIPPGVATTAAQRPYDKRETDQTQGDGLATVRFCRLAIRAP